MVQLCEQALLTLGAAEQAAIWGDTARRIYGLTGLVMDLYLQDKVVLVTGGGAGIGAAIAHVLAAEGAIGAGH